MDFMKKITGLLALSVFWMSCSSDSEQMARLEVRLTDAPGDYESVMVDIQGVEVHTSEGNQTEGWMALDVQKDVYDLLELTNGLDVLLATAELPAGRISQIRLILGANNSIVVGGQSFDLATPSSQQSGLKLNVQADLLEGITYTILLDFDAARSVVKSGNGSYSLKPVIKSIPVPQTGAIKGVITPLDATPAVYAIIGEDTLGTAYPDAEGVFLLRTLQAGNYTVSFNPKEGYQVVNINDVNVSIGVVTHMETVTIPQ